MGHLNRELEYGEYLRKKQRKDELIGILPNFLLTLDYDTKLAVQEYARRAVKHPSGQRSVRVNETWHLWRGIFDYLVCVEYAKHSLQYADDAELPVVYHSRALVFSAQATLDLVAGWLSEHLHLKLRRGQRCFHRKEFREALANQSAEFRELMEKHREFAEVLAEYRDNWIHRVPGKPVLQAGANAGYKIPIDPEMSILDLSTWAEKYVEAKHQHGRAAYDLQEFARLVSSGTSKLVLESLMAALVCTKIRDGESYL